jgi:hypothetical protein
MVLISEYGRSQLPAGVCLAAKDWSVLWVEQIPLRRENLPKLLCGYSGIFLDRV